MRTLPRATAAAAALWAGAAVAAAAPQAGGAGTGDPRGDARLYHEARFLEAVDRDHEGALDLYRRLAFAPPHAGSRFRTAALVRVAESARLRGDVEELRRALEGLVGRDERLAEVARRGEGVLASPQWRAHALRVDGLREAVRAARGREGEDSGPAEERLTAARRDLVADLQETFGRPGSSFALGLLAALPEVPRPGELRSPGLLAQRDLILRRIEELEQAGESEEEVLHLRADLRAVERALREAPRQRATGTHLARRKVRDARTAVMEALLEGDATRVRLLERELIRIARGTGVPERLSADATREERKEFSDRVLALLESGVAGAPDLPGPVRARIQDTARHLRALLDEGSVDDAFLLVLEDWEPLERRLRDARGLPLPPSRPGGR